MGLSLPATAFLNTWLMEAADGVVVVDSYVSVLDQATADEIRGQLQLWRDSLTKPPISRELVEEALVAFEHVELIAGLVLQHPNDAELGAAFRELLRPAAAACLRRSIVLLEEALAQ
jgi:hypothetical protein